MARKHEQYFFQSATVGDRISGKAVSPNGASMYSVESIMRSVDCTNWRGPLKRHSTIASTCMGPGLSTDPFPPHLISRLFSQSPGSKSGFQQSVKIKFSHKHSNRMALTLTQVRNCIHAYIQCSTQMKKENRHVPFLGSLNLVKQKPKPKVSEQEKVSESYTTEN